MEWASGAVSSATPTSAPNTVPNSNGVADRELHNLQRGREPVDRRRIDSPVSNLFNSNSRTYTFNPITTANADDLANNHPNLFLNGYVGGVMVTATSGLLPRISPSRMS